VGLSSLLYCSAGAKGEEGESAEEKAALWGRSIFSLLPIFLPLATRRNKCNQQQAQSDQLKATSSQQLALSTRNNKLPTRLFLHCTLSLLLHFSASARRHFCTPSSASSDNHFQLHLYFHFYFHLLPIFSSARPVSCRHTGAKMIFLAPNFGSSSKRERVAPRCNCLLAPICPHRKRLTVCKSQAADRDLQTEASCWRHFRILHRASRNVGQTVARRDLLLLPKRKRKRNAHLTNLLDAKYFSPSDWNSPIGTLPI